MNIRSQIGHFFLLLTLFLCGILLFLLGFFPAFYSKVDLHSGTYLSRPTELDGVKLNPPAKAYGAFVLLIIDALRMDFATAANMPVAFHAACEKLKMRVDIPTVTMPRLKSMTTGTVSNFIDIVLNVGKIEELDDSLLHRLKQRGDVVSFAGDHTWIQLFPTEFDRHAENTDSFFVNDFYEGDKNVTKVLSAELENTDWTLLILHYLGLDHIGHVEGNESGKINNKLKEMDEAINKILQHKHFSNYLLMVTGDHGMANGGGHGGNTLEELYVPLYFYSKNCSKLTRIEFNEYNQIDLTPTLAILLSIEIPSTSIGCLIPNMLQSLTLEEQLYAYHYNAYHLLDRAKINFGQKRVKKSNYYTWYLNAKSLHQNLLKALRRDGIISNVNFERAKLEYFRVARKISNKLSESLVKFDYSLMFIGLSLTTVTSLQALLSTLYFDKKTHLKLANLKWNQLLSSVGISFGINVIGYYTHCQVANSLLTSVLLAVPLTLAIYLTVDVLRALIILLLPEPRRLRCAMPLPLPLLFCLAIRTLTLGSSSFIEYEELIWYYLGNSLLVLGTYHNLQSRVMSASIAQDNRQALFTIVPICFWQQRKSFVMLIILAWLCRNDSYVDFKTGLMIFWLFLLWARLRKFNTVKIQKVLGAVACILIYSFHGLKGKVNFFELTSFQRSRLELPVLVLFCLSTVGIFFIGYRCAMSKDTFYNSSSENTPLQLLQTNMICIFFAAALLHKTHNVVLLPAMLIVLDETYKLCDAYCTSQRAVSIYLAHVYKIILTVFIAKMFYFYQGNSNSLSTIDLNPGYIGQSSYNPFIVGLFVTFNTYCAEINAFLYLIVHTLREDHKVLGNTQITPLGTEAIGTLVLPLYAVLVILPVALYLCLMVGFRYHLFIYSVFSPKVLYDSYDVFVFYLLFLITSLYLKIFQRDK